MALPYVTVEKTNTPPGTLDDVQSLQMTKGRVKVSDNLRSGTASVSGRKPENLPSLLIGDTIKVTLTDPDTSTSNEYFYRVADFTINYGIVASLDTWSLELEDALAYLGRANYTASWSSVLASTQAALLTNDVGILLIVDTPSKSSISAQSVTNANALTVFQTMANTEQALIQAGDNDINWFSRGWQSAITYTTFADDGTGAKYDSIRFGSLADNYADEVVNNVVGGSPITVGAGVFNYGFDSYSVDTPTATDLANFVKGVFDVQDAQPQSVSTFLNPATTAAPLTALNVGEGLTIKFRGATYKALVEGFIVTSDPSGTRITYNLSSSDFYSFLTLDDVVLGRLNYNKLGF